MTLKLMLQIISENIESLCHQADDIQTGQLKSVLKICADTAFPPKALEDATDDLMDFCYSVPCLENALKSQATRIKPGDTFTPLDAEMIKNKLISALKESRKQKPQEDKHKEKK